MQHMCDTCKQQKLCAWAYPCEYRCEIGRPYVTGGPNLVYNLIYMQKKNNINPNRPSQDKLLHYCTTHLPDHSHTMLRQGCQVAKTCLSSLGKVSDLQTCDRFDAGACRNISPRKNVTPFPPLTVSLTKNMPRGIGLKKTKYTVHNTLPVSLQKALCISLLPV